MCDTMVSISHDISRRDSVGAQRQEVSGTGACSGGGGGGAQQLLDKLTRHAAGSAGFLAFLPDSLCGNVPLLAAQLIWQLIQKENASVLWLLPHGSAR